MYIIKAIEINNNRENNCVYKECMFWLKKGVRYEEVFSLREVK